MSAEVWTQVYDQLVRLIEAHRTTLVFVNTRRMAERVARQLSDRLGEAAVTAHHGSMAKEQRLDAEQRLKRGELKALVATASLELGIDIGDVDLVCQLGSPRSIASFLQRVGRSGHAVGGMPKGRLFPLSRDDLVECAALLDSVRRGELDRLTIPHQPLDVLAQQIVAEVVRAGLARGGAVRPLAPRLAVPRPVARRLLRRRAHAGRGLLHPPRPAWRAAPLRCVNHMLRGRRGARLTALTSGGTIPDTADYQVLLEPENQTIGSVNEDFAVESLAGDIFQLGNTAYRIMRVERGVVRVEDARGQAPTIPFWLGEAPGPQRRTFRVGVALRQAWRRLGRAALDDAASHDVTGMPSPRRHGGRRAVSRHEPPIVGRPCHAQGGPRLPGRGMACDARTPHTVHGRTALADPRHRHRRPRGGAIGRVPRCAFAALECLPTQDTLVLERFFDEAGGMQLVVHSPFGSRINRAWGLALRKRFCRKFNFELQAAATEDNIVLSLTTTHSFDLAEVARYLHAATVRSLLIQALLDAPMFITRWRWVAGVALALPRFRGGQEGRRRNSRAWTRRTWSPRCFPISSPAPRTWWASARFPTTR